MKSRDKKIIYIVLWVVMNALIAILICLSIEAMLLNYCCSMLASRFYVYIPLFVIAIISSLVLAPIAWRKIYIEGAKGKKYIIKNGKQKLWM